MEDVRIPTNPNPFVSAWLVGPQCRAMVFEAAEIAQALYREVVAKRTGALARSAHVSTGIEGGRWVGHLTVGGASADYGLSHEFGHDDDGYAVAGSRDLNAVLNAMGAL